MLAMHDHLTEEEAALVAHKIVLAILVSEAELRLGDEAAEFLDQIRRAAISSVENAKGAPGDAGIHWTKQKLIESIDDIFRGS
jgi:signal transduction protein with GAF and PtsI domain